MPETPPLDDERARPDQAPSLHPRGGSPSGEATPHDAPPAPARHSRLLTVLAALVLVAVLGGAAAVWFTGRQGEDPPGPTPSGSASPTPDPAAGRDRAVQVLLEDRAQAVLSRDRAAFLAQVDPAGPDFVAAQSRLVDRLGDVPLSEWSYQVVGSGPGLSPQRAAELPDGSAVVRVRLTYRLEGTTTDTDREQYLTFVPRGGRWLVAGDTDGGGLQTQRDPWDFGPVRVVQGEAAVVVADRRGASLEEVRRLAGEADFAVQDVGRLWEEEWSERPVVLLPRAQKDMATLIQQAGDGLAQIAAVTTGSFAYGLARGDRVVINPAAFAILGPLGRRVVLSHEMTHVATRATSVRSPPIWLAEGFADYVAYDATPVATSVVAKDVLDDVRDGRAPRRFPEAAEFDASEGDIAAAYEGAWLACRMIAERFGERRLVRFYEAMSDDEGPGWPEETIDVLGITAERLTRDWRGYLTDKAAA